MTQVVAQILPFIRRSSVFAPDVTLAMGEAYDKAIGTVYPDAESRIVVRELIAKRIIRAFPHRLAHDVFTCVVK